MYTRKVKRSLTKTPNFLIIMNDQLRYPPIYDQENDALRKWQQENLKTQTILRRNGLDFKRHYVGATACTPSRATLFTGQYPSLHGVSQTSGVAKTAFDPGMFWLDPNTVPTMGDYFRGAGYQTYYKGKWHFSDPDIIIPNSHDTFLSYNPINGEPIKAAEDIYLNANRTDQFGFTGWLGPEPHGANPRNSGSSAAVGLSGRDIIYSHEAINLINALQEHGANHTPWVMVTSFVNPHDIALYGSYASQSPLYKFQVDPSVPPIPPPPTANEDLGTKPAAQRSYKETYPKAFQPITALPFYRQLYYSLQKKADQEGFKVFEALKNSSFYHDTIVIFTADHGELLGAHGGLFQKWYQAYEESIHVPLIIHNPTLFPEPQSTDVLTSHVDIIPTMLGLAQADTSSILCKLRETHIEARQLVGRNLATFILKGDTSAKTREPIYFMTNDNITQGQNQVSVTGKPYQSVIQPNQVESIMIYLPTGNCSRLELWKYSRYFDSTNPTYDHSSAQKESCIARTLTTEGLNIPHEKNSNQFEMYNLTCDPLEERNLANPYFSSPKTRQMQAILSKILVEQHKEKRLYPRTLPVPQSGRK